MTTTQRARRWAHSLLAAACVLGLGACTSDDDGPLSVGDPAGGFSFLGPDGPPQQRPDRWWASTGSFALCTEGPEVTMEGVRLEGDGVPHEAWLLSDVPPIDDDLVSFGYQLGRPPEFSEPYADQGLVGGSYRRAEGAVVDVACPAPFVTEGGTELVLATRADGETAEMPGFWIDYSADGESHSLFVDWTIVLCGEQPHERCRP